MLAEPVDRQTERFISITQADLERGLTPEVIETLRKILHLKALIRGVGQAVRNSETLTSREKDELIAIP